MAGSSQSLAAKAVIPIAAARYSSRLAVDLRRVVMGLGRFEPDMREAGMLLQPALHICATIHIRRCIEMRTNIVLDDGLVTEAFKYS